MALNYIKGINYPISLYTLKIQGELAYSSINSIIGYRFLRIFLINMIQ